jgi:hypothetical protein
VRRLQRFLVKCMATLSTDRYGLSASPCAMARFFGRPCAPGWGRACLVSSYANMTRSGYSGPPAAEPLLERKGLVARLGWVAKGRFRRLLARALVVSGRYRLEFSSPAPCLNLRRRCRVAATAYPLLLLLAPFLRLRRQIQMSLSLHPAGKSHRLADAGTAHDLATVVTVMLPSTQREGCAAAINRALVCLTSSVRPRLRLQLTLRLLAQ